MTRFWPGKGLPTVLLALIAPWTAVGQTYTVTTVAGNGTVGFSGDGGPATEAGLSPSGVAVDSLGNLYIGDGLNFRVRKVSNGIITTLAGNGVQGYGGDGGPATSAELYSPGAVAVDRAGNVYVIDGCRLREISSSLITTIAGTGTCGYSGDNGPATQAELACFSVAVDSADNVIVACSGNDGPNPLNGGPGNPVVRKVVNGTITTVAGGGSWIVGENCIGACEFPPGAPVPATSEDLWGLSSVCVDSAGNLYLADNGNAVYEVSNGIIHIASSGGAGLVIDYVVVDSSGDLYTAGYTFACQLAKNGVIIAGNGSCGFSGDGGPAKSGELGYISGEATDPAGNVYIIDSNNRVRFVATPGVLTGGIVPIYSSVSVIESGSWVSIYGGDLAGGTFVWNNDFPTILGNVSVTIDNKPAYLWSVSPTQINLQAPDDSTTGIVNVAVETPKGTVNSTVTLAQYAPSFSLLGGEYVAGEIPTPNGNGAFGGGTYDLVGPSNTFSFSTRPVQPGETLVLFGVGFGPTTPNVAAGQAFNGIARTNSPVTITIGGVSANVSFAGITEAGLYQINLTVPSNTGSGDQALQATVNGVQTPIGPVVTVQ